MPLPALLRPPQYSSISVYYLRQGGNVFARASLSVCLSVSTSV